MGKVSFGGCRGRGRRSVSAIAWVAVGSVRFASFPLEFAHLRQQPVIVLARYPKRLFSGGGVELLFQLFELLLGCRVFAESPIYLLL
jgi:hypothetical protein